MPPVTGNRGRERGGGAAAGGSAIDAAVAAALENPVEIPQDVWQSEKNPTLKFKLKSVSRQLIRDAGSKYPEPKIPNVWNEDKGREEPNELDPDYVEARRIYANNIGEVTQRLFLALGTEPMFGANELLGLPGVHPLDDDTWIEEIEELTEVVLPRKGRMRYVSWLRYHVLADDDDRLALNQASMRFNGIIFESDVQAAADSFKSDEARQPDSASEAEAEA